MLVEVDPVEDADVLESLRSRGRTAPARRWSDELSRGATLRTAFWAWLAYFTVRHPSWPLWALLWAVTLVLAAAFSLTVPQP